MDGGLKLTRHLCYNQAYSVLCKYPNLNLVNFEPCGTSKFSNLYRKQYLPKGETIWKASVVAGHF